MFKFGKENLEDADVATLAAATRTLYDELARGADCMTTLLGGAAIEEESDDGRLHQ